MARTNLTNQSMDFAERAAARIGREVYMVTTPSERLIVLAAAIIREEMKHEKPKKNGW